MGDPILGSNITHRVDFALFMVEALENDELVHEARRSSAARRLQRSHMARTSELRSEQCSLAWAAARSIRLGGANATSRE